MADLQLAVSIDPENARIHHSLGDAYFRLDKPERARDSWRDACRLAPRGTVKDWQRRLAAKDFFNDAIDGVCEDRLIEAFQRCAQAKCVF